MIDYKKAYHILCSAASSALDTLPQTAENAQGRELLQKALYEAEDVYIDTADDREEASL